MRQKQKELYGFGASNLGKKGHQILGHAYFGLGKLGEAKTCGSEVFLACEHLFGPYHAKTHYELVQVGGTSPFQPTTKFQDDAKERLESCRRQAAMLGSISTLNVSE